jgi:hypothetical protein
VGDRAGPLVELLRGELDEVAASAGRRLEGLSDEEYLWEPVPGYCWTVRPRGTARTTLANGRGDWVVDYDLPDPSPAPSTTIAWQIVHCHLINEVDHDRFFGHQTMTRLWDEVDVPHTAAAALDAWSSSLGRFRTLLDEVTERDLSRIIDDPVRQVTRPAWWFVQLVANENRHHGAIAGALRDLYLQSNSGYTWRIPG